ncbi:MAG: hypothetical protein ACRDV9_02090 [Acidimicrobiia bacterium]
MQEADDGRASDGGTGGRGMKSASFEYAAPASIGEAVALLDEHSGEEVKLL